MADIHALFDRPISRQQAEPLAKALQAIADRSRLAILTELADAVEATVFYLTERVDLAQPTVSHHLRLLVEAGLVVREQRGVYAWHSVNYDALAQLAAAITPPKRGRRRG